LIRSGGQDSSILAGELVFQALTARYALKSFLTGEVVMVYGRDKYSFITDDGLSFYGTPAPCGRFVPGVSYHRLRLHNTCERRKVFLLSWSDGVITRVTVDGYCQVDIPIRAHGAHLVGEEEDIGAEAAAEGAFFAPARRRWHPTTR
jgi:hypothetical protein